MKTMLLLCALIVGSVSVWAADETITFSNLGLTNDEQYTSFDGADYGVNFSLEFGDGSNDGKYYNTGAAIRVYAGGHMTVSSSNTIEKIELTFGSGDNSNAISTNTGTYSNGTWTGSATSVTFTVGGSSKHRRIASVAVTYQAGVTSLSVKTAPTKTKYKVGEVLDMTGFVLQADEDEVTTGYTMKIDDTTIVNGGLLNSVGKKTIVVSYGGQTVNQAISVGAVTSIEITKAPTKTIYDDGDTFDATGMEVTASLSTGEISDPDIWKKVVEDYTVTPEGALSTSDDKVTITYATKTATQSITVNAVAVTAVALDATANIEIGKTKTLVATITPSNASNKNVSWESDNTDVAIVDDNGVVTGVSAGDANIIVTTDDGGYTATCAVRVVEKLDFADLPVEHTGGRSSLPTGFTQSGLGTDYASNPYLKFDSTGDYLILKINEAPGILCFDIKGNNMSGGTFTLQKSVDGSSYTEVKSYTGLNNTQSSQTIYDLGADIRYIKWIYTEKSSGNVGLGNIRLAKAITATVSSVGWTTFSNENAIDFTGITAVKAYMVTNASGETLTLSQLTGTVPANTGLLICGDAGEKVIIPAVASSSTSVTANKLKAGTGSTVNAADKYVLVARGGKAVFAPTDENAATVAVGKAYLDLEGVTLARGFFLDDSEATGVREIDTMKNIAIGQFYNLAGQRVAQPQKGLYIMNNKKIVIR